MPKSSIDIEIGREILHLRAQAESNGLLDWTADLLAPYRCRPETGGCEVNIVPYWPHKTHPWLPEEIEAFGRFFLSPLGRYPTARQPARTAELLCQTLRHGDPHNPVLAHFRSLVAGNRHLTYAAAASDLFFYDPRSATALLLLKCGNGGAPSSTGLLNGLMFALSHRLALGGGLLVHGCALQRDGRTFLLLGRSGAGKSTSAQLCAPALCFADDGVVVRNENNRFFAYPSPFRQSRGEDTAVSGQKGALERVFLLEKGPGHALLPLRKSELVRVILLHLIHYFKFLDAETARRVFYTVGKLANRLPANRLQFAKSDGLWDLLSGPNPRG